MADSKISNLSAATTLAGTEEFVIATAGTNKKITASNLTTALGSLVATSENFITGAVTIVNANTYYDGPSLSLAAGTWMLTGKVTIARSASGGARVEARLWDGTNVFSEAEGAINGDSYDRTTLPVSALVTLGSLTTVKISAASTAGSSGASILNTLGSNGTANKASNLTAVRIY